MSSPFQLRVGVSNDPDAAPPTLRDLLDAALSQANDLMQQVLRELRSSQKRAKPHSMNVISHPDAEQTLERLDADKAEVAAMFHDRLSEGVMHAGKNPSARLSFNDLGLFDDQDLSESVEIARAHMEITRAVDDVAPSLDALVCTMMGWRTLQDSINPLRSEVYTRALRETLAAFIEDSTLREAIIVPAAGFMGVRLNTMYRALIDWLRSFGIEAAMPEGARMMGPDGSPVAAVSKSVAKTMLTLDKLRNLLMGDFDAKAKAAVRSGGDFGLTVPASYETLEQLKQVDAVVQRLEQRSREEKPAPPGVPGVPEPVADLLDDIDPVGASSGEAAADGAVQVDVPVDEAPARKTLGKQLGEEVVRLMFDNLAHDKRLLPALKTRLNTLLPHVRALARIDSRFFSDRKHPARQYMDRITQRSLAYQSETEPGWARFQSSIDETLRDLATQEAGADRFTEMLAKLDERWAQLDEGASARRAEAAQALAHAEQRNLLAQRLTLGIEETMKDRDVAPTVADFLRASWSLVIAESRLKNTDASSDPNGYEALVEDLLWSVDFRRARRNPNRLVTMIPGLLASLRVGLKSIDYPAELTSRFFERLIALHDAVLGERRAAARQALTQEGIAAARAARVAARAAPSDLFRADEVWLANHEADESGFIGGDSMLAPDMDAGAQRMEEARQEATSLLEDSMRASDLRMGSWIELHTDGAWVRAQLTWASPHGTLFMFTSAAGAAHSMSKRIMERLLAEGAMRIVSEGQLVDQALDQVAHAALRNSLKAD